MAPLTREASAGHSPEREGTPRSDTEDSLDGRRADTQDDDPDQFSAKARSEKRMSETEASGEQGDKRQKISDQETHSEDDNQDTQETKERKCKKENHEEETGTDEKTLAKSEDTSKTNKRQADTRGSDAEEREETGSKVKRTRRLRRGLRLCTNITCYIEQVLYN